MESHISEILKENPTNDSEMPHRVSKKRLPKKRFPPHRWALTPLMGFHVSTCLPTGYFSFTQHIQLGGLLRGPNRTLGHWASRRNTPEFGFFRVPILDEYEYRIARYGNVWTSDDSNKAWGMLFESEAWPLPFRVK